MADFTERFIHFAQSGRFPLHLVHHDDFAHALRMLNERPALENLVVRYPGALWMLMRIAGTTIRGSDTVDLDALFPEPDLASGSLPAERALLRLYLAARFPAHGARADTWTAWIARQPDPYGPRRRGMIGALTPGFLRWLQRAHFDLKKHHVRDPWAGFDLLAKVVDLQTRLDPERIDTLQSPEDWDGFYSRIERECPVRTGGAESPAGHVATQQPLK